MIRSLLYSAPLFVALGHSGLAASIYDDSFASSGVSSQWSTLTDNPGVLDLVQQSGRLEAIANAPVSINDDALYLSNGAAGFRLSTTSDFEITLGYDFTQVSANGPTGTAMTLVFGVGRDLDGFDSAAIGYGFVSTDLLGSPIVLPGLGGAYRTNDVQTESPLGFGASSGTFRIVYDSVGDVLTLGDGALSYSLTDVVRAPGAWNADSLYVSMGVRGNGFTLNSGDASLDNFSVVSGTVLPIPEPTPSVLCLGGLLLLVGRRQRC